MSRSYAPGTWIWVPDEETVWSKAEVLELPVNGRFQVRIEDSNLEQTVTPEMPTHVCNLDVFSSEGLMGLDDLTQLTHLHEPAVLNSLNLRFDVDKIYTFTGPILIAVNPFKTISSMYDAATIQRFLKLYENATTAQKREPHVFSTGSVAFRGLCNSKMSQTICISGESGAGKTESTKFVMKFLALAGSEDWNNRSQIENQVLQSNPLLEALGNAKTLRNDNSSRFGKFIEMQFTLAKQKGSESMVGKLAGARIHTYLLETVRVCHQLEGERNYHSFYQLCGAAAASDENGVYKFPTLLADKAPNAQPFNFDLSKFGSYDKFQYLTGSSCSKLKRIDDVEEFESTILAMQTIGIPMEDQVALWNVIGAVLHIGNLKFECPAGNSEASAFTEACRDTIKTVSELLSVSVETLELALTVRTITARSETYKIPLKLKEAEEARDALAKALYGTAFLKLVKATNQSIGYREDVKLFCGVLDIFGFECFQYNSFEQLCINFTNERLQQFFNNFIFKCEEQLYKREGISWSSLDFPDNQDCVDLMEMKNVGIFAMLDEECIVPRGSDKGFCNKMKEKHKDNKRFAAIKTKQEWFIVNHFAGPVSYCSDGFLDKNRDQLSVDCQTCIKESKSEFVKSLFVDFLNRGGAEEKGAKKRTLTVSSEFRSQLSYLMETVAVTEPHFIRCIKPNGRNVPDEFERINVTEQLRYGGVLQAVQVSRAGYPVRLLHKDAYLDYRHLCSKSVLASLEVPGVPDKQKAEKMMQNLDETFQFPKPQHSANSWAVGQTMVFFKHESYEVLSTERANQRVAKATVIQSRWRGFIHRRFHQHLRLCTIVIQTHMRAALARRRAQGIREERAVSRIQMVARGYLARQAYLNVRANIVCIQSAFRGYKARLEMAELRKFVAAQKIQAHWRGYRARTYYRLLKRGAQKAQLRWRQILAKRQLRRLKQEQREAVALLGQKQKLQDENKVLKAKIDESSGHLALATAEKNRLLQQVATLESEVEALRVDFAAQESQFKMQIEDLKCSTQLKRLSSNVSCAGDRKMSATASLANNSSTASSGATSAPSSPEPRRPADAHETDTPSPLESRLPPWLIMNRNDHMMLHATPEESHENISPVSEHKKHRARENSLRKLHTLSEDLHHSQTAAQLEKAIQEARQADAEVMVEKDTHIASLEEQVKKLEQALSEQTKKATESDQRYQVLLKNEDLKAPAHIRSSTAVSISHIPSPSGSPKKAAAKTAGFNDGCKGIDILVLGDKQSGKSALLDALVSTYGNTQQAAAESVDEGAVIRHHRISFNEHQLVVAEYLGSKGDEGIRDWAFKSRYLIIVYDLCDEQSYRHAHQSIKMTSQHPYRMCFGNRAGVVDGREMQVNLSEVKDHAARCNCAAVEGSSLADVIDGIWNELNQQVSKSGSMEKSASLKRETVFASAAANSTGGVGITSFMSRIHSYFGTTDRAKFGGQTKNSILRPSCDQTIATTQRLAGQTDGCMQPIAELPDHAAAITCVAFGRERAHRDYYLLAAACKDGSATVYRVNRTEIEKQMWDEEFAASASATLEDAPSTERSLHSDAGQQDSGVTVVVQLFGHTRAITHMFFSYKDDQLVTTSIDKSVRFWSVETGDMLKVFADSTSCLVAAFLPFNPHLFIVGNANSILRVVDIRNGKVIQKLRAESEVRALKFDETGLYCYAGTRSGMLHVLESNDNGMIQFNFKTKLSKGSITCITYVPSMRVDTPPQLFVNSCDSTITIVDCIYGQPTGAMTTLVIRNRIKIAHALLPLRCCYSPAGMGWLISASEDRNVHIYSLAPGAQHRSVLLRRHQAPIIAVAVNQLNTVLASADSCGKLILWRWMQYGPPTEQLINT